jgi:hypothetical protein
MHSTYHDRIVICHDRSGFPLVYVIRITRPCAPLERNHPRQDSRVILRIIVVSLWGFIATHADMSGSTQIWGGSTYRLEHRTCHDSIDTNVGILISCTKVIF